MELNKKKKSEEVSSFLRWGSYSSKKGCFQTKFKVLRGVDEATLDKVLDAVFGNLKVKVTMK